MWRAGWIITLAGAAWVAALGSAAQEHPVFNTKIEPPQAPMLRDMLKAGGYVIHFRHGTTPDYQEPSPVDFAKCDAQRNLNALGRAQAFTIGEAFRELGIAVGEVRASPFCRCMETARIAFGHVEADESVRGDKDKRERLRVLFAAPPDAGTNRVLVGHGTAGDMIGEEFLREAEAIVVKPEGDGKFRLIARVRAESWTQWLERNRQPPPGTPRAGQ